MTIRHSFDDLPSDVPSGHSVAIDTEAMGLVRGRDRLCLVQVSWGDGDAYLVQVKKERFEHDAPRLKALLADPQVEKIFHFGRFDIGMLYGAFGVLCTSVYCTKIASRLTRTYTDRHGLKDICRELLGVEISKTEQMSDWGKEELTAEQKRYAASDVLYLHALRKKFDAMLEREERMHLAKACFSYLPHRVLLDCMGFGDDMFVP